MSVTQDDHPHHLPTLQAPVKALDPHGTVVVGWGTVLFALGTAVCAWQLPALEAIGRGWWLTTGMVGTGMGAATLIVLLAVRRRRLG